MPALEQRGHSQQLTNMHEGSVLFHFAQLWNGPQISERGWQFSAPVHPGYPLYGQLESTVAGKQIGSRILRIARKPVADTRGATYSRQQERG